ncbi:class I SAM-dependent DNA methyltransferase [Aliarcobacter sp. ERUVET-7]|uniref:class I SAM-dependent DNA methyltransferase n=2 Tax=Aliarcobacter TaxID=2321111 RepID=UPI003D6B71A1
MAKYHKYVFDVKNRKLVGDFETMYQNESKENFDSWHQDDTRQLQRKIDLAILEDYNFSKIIDIGCGKGSLSHLLKKKNNYVLGLDISQTAVNIAQERFPDIDFLSTDVNQIENFSSLMNKMGGVNLVFTSEVFSYIENWKELLVEISKSSEYFMISLYIPENPIGFVKSENDLVEEIEKNFEVIEHISLNTTNFVIVFAKRKNI